MCNLWEDCLSTREGEEITTSQLVTPPRRSIPRRISPFSPMPLTLAWYLICPKLQVTVESLTYHKSCFKCSHGGCAITPSNYAALEGILYCKHHFSQLFKEKGSYSHLIKSASMKQAAASATEEAWTLPPSWLRLNYRFLQYHTSCFFLWLPHLRTLENFRELLPPRAVCDSSRATASRTSREHENLDGPYSLYRQKGLSCDSLASTHRIWPIIG